MELGNFSNLLPGGFTGVDIFFVISGFLISSHLIHEIYIKNDFSFKRFYLKRIKRILPALLFMILLVMFFGYFVFTKYYFQSLGEQAIAATLSYSNIYFYLTSGYFDLDSNLKPLLHTWSLGVEEQFYLVWPAVLTCILFFKKPRYLIYAFMVFFALSISLNALYSDDLSAIFYLMPFRIFEFTVGASIAYISVTKNNHNLIKNNYLKNILSFLGLFLIMAPMLYLDEDNIFPYYNALPTIIGSGLLIYNRSTISASILSKGWLVFIGLISYSLYLYHWPVIVFAKYEFGITNNIELFFIVFIFSTILATFSYHVIEKPFRFSRRPQVPKLFLALTTLVIATSTASSLAFVGSYNSNKELISKMLSEANKERFLLLNNNGCDITEKDKTPVHHGGVLSETARVRGAAGLCCRSDGRGHRAILSV